MGNTRQKVVIIGHGYTSRLAVIRSVAQIGSEVTVIVMTNYKRDGKTLNTKKPIDCYSKYVSHVYYCYAKDEEGLIQLLLDKCSDSQQKVVIIPDSDFSAAAIDRNQKRLKEHFLFPHIRHTSGAIIEWMDKVRQKQLAREIGLNVASSCVIDINDRKYVIPSEVRYPCFTKALATVNGGGKRIFRRCNNETELRNALDLAASISDMQVLVEDFKKIETEYAVVGFSDGKEVIIPGIIQILEMAHGGHFGVACLGKVMPVNGFEELVAKFKQFMQHVGFVGVFDIDFYQSEGKMYFGELNLRFGGSGYAVTKMGVNLPGMLVKTVVGEKIDGMKETLTSTATFVNERMCMDDWYSGFISINEYKNLLERANISFVQDDADSTPQKHFSLFFLIRYIKKLAKKYIKKPKISQ